MVKHINLNERYKLFSNGKLFDKKLNRYIKAIFNKGYFSYSLVLNGERKAYLRHRLVATAFVKNDDPAKKIYVNHKNGIKGHDDYSNLEWVTSKENREHAIYTNLTPVSKSTVVTYEDNSTECFNTMKQAAKATGITYNRVKKAIRKNNPAIIDKIMFFVDNVENNNGKTKIVWRSLKTGEAGEFSSLKKAAEALNISIYNIAKRLEGPVELLHKDGYQLRRKRDFVGWPEVGDFQKAYDCKSWIKRLDLKWLDSGEEEVYDNQATVAKLLKISQSHLTTKLNRDGQILERVDGRYCLIKRKSLFTEWQIPEDYEILYLKNKGLRPVKAENAETGTKIIFESLKECAFAFNCNLTTMSFRVNKTKNAIDGYIFNYV